MRMCREYSNGEEKMLKLAEALVESARDQQQLHDWAFAIWPRLSVYTGDTHLRFMPEGQLQESFYVDLTQ